MAISKEDILEGIGGMSVLDLSELIKEMEEKFGVSAAAVAAAPAAAGGSGDAAAVEEKTEFDLHLTAIGDNKVNTIKAVREITGLGLKEAKDIVDAAHKVVKETLDKASAEEALKKLTDAGATGELK
jgi:large subunit ribosomal protein L7/L12